MRRRQADYRRSSGKLLSRDEVSVVGDGLPLMDFIFHRMTVSSGRQADATRLKSRGKHRRL